MERKRYKRIKRTIQCPNPVFKNWLTEWRDQAKEKGWKTHHTYSKAIKALAKYPLTLRSGKEAKILEYFGDKICNMIDKKIDEAGGVQRVEEMSENLLLAEGCEPRQRTKKPNAIADIYSSGDEAPSQSKKTRKRCSVAGYCPSPRSGPYAILLILFKNWKKGCDSMLKNEIISQAQPFCETSFTVPEPGTYYTAWSSMGTLIKRGLIKKEHRPTKYELTDNGMKLAEAIYKADNNAQDDNAPDPNQDIDVLTSANPSTSNNYTRLNPPLKVGKSSSQSRDKVYYNIVYPEDYFSTGDDRRLTDVESDTECQRRCLLPGSYDVILIVDTSETNGCASFGGKNSKSLLIPELRKNGVNFEVRKLHVGDFVWIAKEKVLPVPGCLQVKPPLELVLDFIVERKRMDDLASSIKDGRFLEQKFRLKNCGLKRPIYLVENFGKSHGNFGIPESSLHQAIANTQIINGFTIRHVHNSKESVAYLTMMTRHLISNYQEKTLWCCQKENLQESSPSAFPNCNLLEFSEFNSSSIKNKHVKVSDMLVKFLLKIGGMSPEKATAIVATYPTVSHLLEAYSKCDSDKEKELLLAKVKSGKTNRNMGPALSQVVYNLFHMVK